jgi:hypothetical protein
MENQLILQGNAHLEQDWIVIIDTSSLNTKSLNAKRTYQRTLLKEVTTTRTHMVEWTQSTYTNSVNIISCFV